MHPVYTADTQLRMEITVSGCMVAVTLTNIDDQPLTQIAITVHGTHKDLTLWSHPAPFVLQPSERIFVGLVITAPRPTAAELIVLARDAADLTIMLRENVMITAPRVEFEPSLARAWRDLLPLTTMHVPPAYCGPALLSYLPGTWVANGRAEEGWYLSAEGGLSIIHIDRSTISLYTHHPWVIAAVKRAIASPQGGYRDAMVFTLGVVLTELVQLIELGSPTTMLLTRIATIEHILEQLHIALPFFSHLKTEVTAHMKIDELPQATRDAYIDQIDHIRDRFRMGGEVFV